MKTKINPINKSKFNSLFCKDHKWVIQNQKQICLHCKIEKVNYDYQVILLKKELNK